MPRDLAYGKSIISPDAESILSDIQSRSALKVDRVVNTRHMSAISTVQDGMPMQVTYRVRDNLSNEWTDIEYNHTAFAQLLNRIRIPVSFYIRNPAYLQIGLFDHWTHETNADLLLRQILDGEQPVVRAVLSDSYGIMDDDQVFPAVIEALQESGQEITYHRFAYDDKVTQLLVKFPDTERSYGATTFCAGLMVTNSEIGQSSVWIEPVVFHGSFNIVGRQTLNAQKLDMRIIHKGTIDTNRVKQMTIQMKDIAQVGIIQMAEAWNNRIAADHALRFAKNVDSLPKRMVDILEEEWAELVDISRAEVALRIMELARTLPLFQRTQVGQSACVITGVFNNYQTRMSEILAEMEEG